MSRGYSSRVNLPIYLPVASIHSSNQSEDPCFSLPGQQYMRMPQKTYELSLKGIPIHLNTKRASHSPQFRGEGPTQLDIMGRTFRSRVIRSSEGRTCGNNLRWKKIYGVDNQSGTTTFFSEGFNIYGKSRDGGKEVQRPSFNIYFQELGITLNCVSTSFRQEFELIAGLLKFLNFVESTLSDHHSSCNAVLCSFNFMLVGWQDKRIIARRTRNRGRNRCRNGLTHAEQVQFSP